jgi:hypothetical protein
MELEAHPGFPSTKTPDLLFEVSDATGTRQYAVAVEVGFSESYTQLIRDTRLLLTAT